MKKLIILFVSVALFLSCGKLDITPDDNDDTGNSSTKKVSGNMKATLDGKSWEAKSLAFGGLLALTDVLGKIDDSNLISFQFADPNLEVGKTYEFDSKNFEANLNSTLLVKIADKAFFSKSGTFKITKYKKNQVIEGEISAELSNFIDPSIELKNCKFSMEYK
jgi:hypothetical protein